MADESNSQESKQLSKQLSQEAEQLSKYMTWLGVVLVLFALSMCYYAITIATHVWTLGRFPHGADDTLVAVIVAIFGVLITGVFVFMTFRIDRGAKLEAQTTAKFEAEQVLKDVKENAEEAVRKAIERDEQQILKKASDAAEKFAVNIANVLRSRIDQTLTDLHPDTTVTIDAITTEDGHRRDGQA